VYLGTTDTTYGQGAGVWPSVDLADVEYLLEPVGRYFRTAPIRADEVIAAWAGLRPLIAEPGKPPTEISRRDEVLVGAAGVVTLAGGKLTGYRLMARDTVAKAAEVGGLRLGPAPAEEPPLPGGDFAGDLASLEAGLCAELGLSPECAARLARLYGSESRDVAAAGAEPLLPGAPVLASEVDWAVRVEGAARVEDVIYRRLRTAWYTPGAREQSVEPVAARMAALLSWAPERTRAEVEAVRARLAADLGFLAQSRP
jgi:glycerol-3-phosphate dehydrogenase